MADKVRGLTVEISADASKFKKQLNEVSREAKNTQSELYSLKKGLELEFDASKFKQAQAVAQKAIDETNNKADILTKRLEYLEKIDAVDTAQYSELTAELAKTNLQAQRLQKDLEELNDIKLNNLTSGIDKVADGLTKAGKAAAPFSAAAGGILAGFAALGNKAISTGANIEDVAIQLGVSAEKLQEWQYVATQTGVSTETFNKAIIKARAAMLDMSSGKANDATDAIASLGLEFDKFKNNGDLYDGIITSLGNMTDKSLQAHYANKIFGNQIANEIIPMLNTATDEINMYKEEFAAMPSLTDNQVNALASLDDAIFRVKETFKHLALQIGAGVAPVIKSLVSYIESNVIPKISKVVEWFSNLDDATKNFGAKALGLIAILSPVLLIMGKLAGGVSAIVGSVGKLNTAFTTLAANPIIAIVGIIAALLLLLYTTNEEFRESINNLIGTLMGSLAPVLDIIMGVLQTLITAIQPLIDIVGNILAGTLNILMARLTPVFEMLGLIFALIGPLIEIALLPLQMALKGLEIPLQLIGALLEWLMPLFNGFSKIVKGAFDFILKIINFVLGEVEKAINWVINKINGLIDGINKMGGWLGVDIKRLDTVSLQMKSGNLGDIEDAKLDTSNAPTGSPYDNMPALTGGGTYISNDYSTSQKTQHVTVTIQNYAEEVDVDNLVDQINIKLAEAL